MIMQELRLQDTESFRKYLRMNTTVYEVCFLIILHRVMICCEKRTRYQNGWQGKAMERFIFF